MTETLYSLHQIAQELHLALRTIQKWREAGRFPNARQVNPEAKTSAWLVPASDLDALKEQLAKNKVE